MGPYEYISSMQRKKLGPNGEYLTRLLHPSDIRATQAMFERASDYFEVATGAPPARDEATRAFVAGPPSKSVDDKRIVGIFDRHNELIGVLDALVDFPESGDWTMGMLLLDPEHRGAGLGTVALEAYEDWAVGRGAKRFHTAVVSCHKPGIRFLENCGYSEQREIQNYDAGARRATVVLFAKDPGAGTR